MALVLAAFCGPVSAKEKRFELQSSDFPVWVDAGNPEYGGLVLELLDRSFYVFAQRTGIKSFGPISFRFVLEDPVPTEANFDMESGCYGRVLDLGKDKEFRIDVPSREFNPIALVRTAMICQVEAFGMRGMEWKPDLKLPPAPFWLTEGFTQAVLDKKTPSLEKILGRVGKKKIAPDLETVLGWQEISPHRVEQWLQEACCYRLVSKATATVAERERLAAWIELYYQPNPQPYRAGDDGAEDWWKKALAEKPRLLSPEVSDYETREDLQRSLEFQAKVVGEDSPRDFNLARLPKPPLEFTSAKPFEQVMANLIRIQAKGNYLWQEIIEDYRAAYTLWLRGKYAEYQKRIALAEAKTKSVEAYGAKVKELLDWYEVNHPASGPKFSTLLRQSLAFQERGALEAMESSGESSRSTRLQHGR